MTRQDLLCEKHLRVSARSTRFCVMYIFERREILSLKQLRTPVVLEEGSAEIPQIRHNAASTKDRKISIAIEKVDRVNNSE